MMPIWRAFAGIACVIVSVPFAHAADLTLDVSSHSATLPTLHPDWSVPADTGMVFYLQRSINQNTVVYTARYDKQGNLDQMAPMSAFWRRYSDGGSGKGNVKPLSWIEQHFAYGIQKHTSSETNAIDIRFTAIPNLSVTLLQSVPYDAQLWIHISGRAYQMIYGYVEIAEKHIIPKVTRLQLYTRDPKTGTYVTHIISVSGGAIRE